MIALGVIGFGEYLELVSRLNSTGTALLARAGYLVVVALGCSALLDGTRLSLLSIAVLAVVSPLVLLFPGPMQPGGLTGWSLVSTGSLYLGLPIYAAVATREMPGTIDAAWLSEAAWRLAFAADPAPRGLAWVLVVILTIWVGDSVALLAGRKFGKQKLAPNISPQKSREGSIAGFAASVALGALSFQSFGLGDWRMGLVAGALIGLTGQVGDLAESVLKRQAGVKDSGSVIPGHGGVLDRVDALLFAFPAGFLMASGFERFGS
jgi:phosphatidate cytidylyltransferase